MKQQSGLERRMSNRIPTTLGMQVYAYGVLVASGVSVEMSEHGLLIRIQHDYSADELDPGKHLDVMLEPSLEIPSERWMPIRVVRKWEEGIAARFIGVDATSTQAC
jgi:hypothetical protein